MKKWLSALSYGLLTSFVSLAASPVLADLPVPPSNEMPSGSKGWIDVFGALVYKALSIGSVVIGAAILLGVAAIIFSSYHVAHQKQDLGHFFKMMVVGLLAAAIGTALIYVGAQAIPSA
jgi:hypothetical protein